MKFNSPRLDPWDVGDVCVICGNPFVDRHHVFPGSRRQFSDRWGFVIPLCRKHHGEAHSHPNTGLDLRWKQEAQSYFEQHYGTREDFIRECGMSYLED